MIRPALILCTAAILAMSPSTAASVTTEDARAGKRVFDVRHAARAREVARWECKPLVVHFVPDSRIGASQLDSFYVRPNPAMARELEGVVVVVVPTERYAPFARQLGITGPGGYRTISAYDLSVIDEQSAPTCRSGFV